MKTSKRPLGRRRRGTVDLEAAESKFFDSNLAYSIIVLANLIARNTSRHTLRDAPVNVNEWRILRLVETFGPICASDVIELFGIDKTTAGRAVSRLSDLKLVKPAPDPADRRRTLISSTSAGRRLHARIAPRDRAYDASFEKVLSRDEVRRFHQLMKRLRPHAQRLLAGT